MNDELTKLHRDLISHTKKLGYFSTDKGCPDAVAFDELVEMGFAEFIQPPSWMGGGVTYILTSKARQV